MINRSSSSSRTALVALSNFSPFGNKIIQGGYVTIEQLQESQLKSREENIPITQALEEITGEKLSPELQRYYKKHQLFELKILYGLAEIDLEINSVAPQQVAYLIEKFVPIQTCQQFEIVPLRNKETDFADRLIKEGYIKAERLYQVLHDSATVGAKPFIEQVEELIGDIIPYKWLEEYRQQEPFLVVAMVNPDDLGARDQLKNQILRRSGTALQRRVIMREDYQQLISAYLEERANITKRRAEQEENKKLDFNAGEFDGSELEDAPQEAEVEDIAKLVENSEEAPVIRAVNIILVKALSEGVSDIHVEPQEEHLQIRMRKDGVLQEYYRFPKKVIPAITSRFKIIANLDIAERRQAQDGRIRRVFKGRTVDFRVNSLPGRYGEKIVLRILDSSSTQLGLDKLITDEETLALVRETASRPFGLILVTGPTGSGKSTSLYSVLAERNEPGINISTAEDPIEYALPGITQCQVIREKGLTFANILRAFLRQDPDVLLVGETRDKETAKTAIEAALTGHLVLTTLHTNDAAGAIARLDEMGVESFMVSAALLGVLAQRLMRRVCSECRQVYTPEDKELRRYGLVPSQEKGNTFYRGSIIPVEDRKTLENRGDLCKKCSGTGYKGRVGVYEFMKVTERLQTLITQRAPTEQIKEAAVEEGMKTLLQYSLNLVREGYTTFEEVERVTFTDSGLEAEMKRAAKQNLICKTCHAELKPEWMECSFCLTPRFE